MPWQLTIQPRRWQLAALERWIEDHRGVASVVTGGGKTIFAYLCMLNVRERWPDAQTVIVVPTTALLDQWYVGLREDLDVPADDIAIYGGGSRPKQRKKVNVMVVNTARRVAPALSIAAPTFLIVDECHRSGSPMNAQALAGSHVAALGLSATPVREYDRGFEEQVVPALGPVIYEYDYEAAHEDKVITPFELINVRVPLLPDEQEKYNALSHRIIKIARRPDKSAEGQSDERLKRLLQRRAAVSASAAYRVPTAVKLAELQRGQRCLIFHERVSSADAIEKTLKARGFRVATYHTKIGASIRREHLRQFRKGMLDCLVTCRALDEGTNVPETSVAIIASSTASMRQRIQRLGRVLRPARGKTSAVVYTVYATDLEERRLQREAERMQEITTVTWLKGAKHGHV